MTQIEPVLHIADVREPYDILSRFFGPWMGIDEDPVTGSAHCVLAPFWTSKLRKEPGAQLRARQCSPQGGDLTVWCDAQEQRVHIQGTATVVVEGVLHV